MCKLELKPCPFCGGGAYIKKCSYGFYVRCKSEKGIYDNGGYIRCYLSHSKTYVYETQERAAQAWNTRHERTCHYVEVTPGGTAGRCGECGTMLHYQDNYCPKCGDKVVS